MKSIKNFENIEIQLDWVDDGNRIQIPFHTNFQNKKIVLIQAFDEHDFQRAPSVRKMIKLDSVPGFLTLIEKSGEAKIKQMPLISLLSRNIFSRPLNGLIIDNSRSYIEFPGIVIDDTSKSKSFILVFHFED